MGSTEIFVLLLSSLLWLFIAYVAGRLAFKSGRKRGYRDGRRDGWMYRHGESTEGEREAWRQRTEKQMLQEREQMLAAYKAELIARGLEKSPVESGQNER